MGGMIYLQSPAGVPIGMTLPLHATIAEQWKLGALCRVTEDGEPWEGDEHDLSGVEGAEPETPAEGGGESGQPPEDPWSEPERPDITAPVKAWREYAAALGATTAEEAAGMSKPELIKLCTPPEADPLQQKE